MIYMRFSKPILAAVALQGICFAFCSQALASTGPQGFTYQGRLLDSTGDAPLQDTVNITAGIYDPSGRSYGSAMHFHGIRSYDVSLQPLEPTNQCQHPHGLQLLPCGC